MASYEEDADVDPSFQEIWKCFSSTGRSTLYCCLSCGMPYSFPDSAYTSPDRDVQSMLLFTHKLRKELSASASTTARQSTMQWQANQCHYIHRFLHPNLICHIATADPAHWSRVATKFKSKKKKANDKKKGQEDVTTRLKKAAAVEKRTKTWEKDLVLTFNRLIAANRFKQGAGQQQQAPAAPNNMCFIFNERLMEYTSEWCNACNMEATNHIKIKDMLFGMGSTEDDRGVFNPLLNIPLYTDLPVGMKLMHDAYLFIYIMCTCLAVFVKKLATLERSSGQAQVVLEKITQDIQNAFFLKKSTLVKN